MKWFATSLLGEAGSRAADGLAVMQRQAGTVWGCLPKATTCMKFVHEQEDCDSTC